MLPQHRPTTIPGLASSVSELEPVTFRLRRLEVSLVFISSAHLTWLLASSVKSLQHVSISPISHIGAGVVDGFPDVYDDLSTLLGPHVTSLHVARCDHRRRHPNLQQILRRWRNVTDLHVDGHAGLEAVVADVGSLPPRLTVSCPWQCTHDIATAIRDPSWQRHLHEISVFEIPNTVDYAFFDILATDRRSDIDTLRAACEARNIVLHWQS
ncbi:hypothetical protein EXIGLDRAFT_772822 [Exidia glandulosa HHB12029]|uniref:Uncharacterized protein n=1 Tax=Exidia glandulosa HHB12029 TaxID=1314781 RepID=A0A165F4E9_EXIGL|nr:hypothetical protein EXIGLDRAFT_772822 [Exidia glandulosa HHB12029]